MPIQAEDAPHILVVDGDDAELERVGAALQASGYVVSTADIPDIGLVRRVEPDAVVLGLVYRGQLSGLAFLERHVSDSATSSIPVIVHADTDRLTVEQWGRLAAIGCASVPSGGPTKRLLGELQRVLANAAATSRREPRMVESLPNA